MPCISRSNDASGSRSHNLPGSRKWIKGQGDHMYTPFYSLNVEMAYITPAHLPSASSQLLGISNVKVE